MLDKAKRERKDREDFADNWTDFMAALNKQNLVLTPWCQEQDCET